MASSILIKAVACLVSSAVAAPVTGGQGSTADHAKEEARQAFIQGQERYKSGRYDEAIEFFLTAQRLAPAPLLVFNIAQAFRLKGACTEASQNYQLFLDQEKARPDLRKLAQSYVEELEKTCVTETPKSSEAAIPAPAVPPVPDRLAKADADVETKPQASLFVPRAAPPPRDPPKASNWALTTLLTSGATLTAVAGAVALWNARTNDEWTREDEALRQAPRSGPDVEKWARRQNANDDRLRTIEQMDKVALGSVVAGGLLLLVGGGMWANGKFGVQMHGQTNASLTFAAPF